MTSLASTSWSLALRSALGAMESHALPVESAETVGSSDAEVAETEANPESETVRDAEAQVAETEIDSETETVSDAEAEVADAEVTMPEIARWLERAEARSPAPSPVPLPVAGEEGSPSRSRSRSWARSRSRARARLAAAARGESIYPRRREVLAPALAHAPAPSLVLTPGQRAAFMRYASRFGGGPARETLSAAVARELGLPPVGPVEVCLPEGPDERGDGFDHCCRLIRRLRGSFYIGISEAPDRRFEEHRATYDGMVVLLQAPNSRISGAMERRLIAEFRGTRCHNYGVGGERPSFGSPHYVYVVYRHDGLLRRG